MKLDAREVVLELVAFVEEALRPRQVARQHDEEGERQVGDGVGVLARRVDQRQARAR